jgi:ABC-type cobalamin/Fe3+-siderophores transport system ATPase subunit
VAADGAPHEVLAPETIRHVFGVEAQLRQDTGGKPRIFYDD